MTELRERWEGVSLPGDYLLERWVNAEDNAGYFEASTAVEGERVTVKVVPQSDPDGSAQLALWQRTQSLKHPNLRGILDYGRAELDGQIVLYAVLEQADDTLANALKQGPLSEPEAREVLEAVLSAVRYLQAQGLAVGTLDPDHVVAVGDTIKVASDGLREVPVDAPFRHELRNFWDKVSPSPTVRRKAILSEVLGEEPVVPEAPPPVPEVVPITAAAGLSKSPVTETPRAFDAVPFPPDEAPRTGNRFPKWIFVGAAGVVLLVLGLNLRRPGDSSAQSGSAPPTPVSTTIVSKSEPKAPAAAPRTPAETKPSPLADSARPASGKAMWRVIAFTYRTHEAAKRKADQINKAHPHLAATVFSPREKKGYYLVALGGRMTREDALRMKNRARADRVTRDAYIQNYLD